MTDKKDYKPFKYITAKYNISQSALYKRIQKFNTIQLKNKTGVRFQKKYMIKDQNKWLVDPAGIKLITFQKRNSTSPFKPKKINHYNEKHATRNDLIDKVNDLTATNSKLVKSLVKLTNNNAQLTNELHKQGDQLRLSEKNNDHLTKSLEYTKKPVKHSFWWHLWHKY